jgi:hypothetical protein
VVKGARGHSFFSIWQLLMTLFLPFIANFHLSPSARLLRAYSIDYSWHHLATWVNITEQWPYRTSWIIWYFEDNEDLDETITLKEIYDK